MEQALKVGRVFLHEIPESRLPQWSLDVWEAVMLAMEEDPFTSHPLKAKSSKPRRRGGRRGRPHAQRKHVQA